MELRGKRYITARNEDFSLWIQSDLRTLDYDETVEFYEQFLNIPVSTQSLDDWALLGCNDRYFLLTQILNREDALHSWLFDRCREVEREPDGYLDLWSRFHYKAVDVNEPVLTVAGWKPHGSLEPGDKVFGPDGKPTRVVARTKVFTDADCYEVTLSDGYSVVVSGDHLWTIEVQSKRRLKGGGREGVKTVTVNTRELAQQIEISKATSTRIMPRIPLAAAPELPHVDLPIDPYVLGVWLGDGTTGCNTVTASLDDADEVQALIASAGHTADRRTHSNAATLVLDRTLEGKRGTSKFNAAMRQLGIYTDKAIPEIYMMASASQRWSLLQGLMDTDGHAHKKHGQAQFVSAKESLAQQVVRLCWSLGFNTTITKRLGKYRGTLRPFWQVSFQTNSDRAPFRMARKIANCPEAQYTRRYRRINSVVPVPSRPVSCIQVDREDGLYCIGERFVTTHNSSIITFAGTIQEIVCDPEITIGIFAATNPIAKPFLVQLQQEMERNEKLKLVYPDVFWTDPKKQSPAWSREDGIRVKRQTNPKENTVEAYGLIEGLPTGRHFRLLIYDDLVNERLARQPEQIKKCTEQWELSAPLGVGEHTRKWHVGTRYCTVAGTLILMADWTCKRIADVIPGDKVVGWSKRDGDNKRFLVETVVERVGCYPKAEVNTYHFDDGSSVTCTPDHRWWRGAHGSGEEYKPLSLPGRKRRAKGVRAQKGMGYIRQLCIPIAEPWNTAEAGWLSGMYDGEGSWRQNPGNPSGQITICQSENYPSICDRLSQTITSLGFDYSKRTVETAEGWATRFDWYINGGWTARYRFLAGLAPSKRQRIADSLFGQLNTRRRKLVDMVEAGNQDTYWLQTETGNYIADGFCSSNSFGDTYGIIMDRKVLKPRLYPATDNGRRDGKPVFMSQEGWDKIKVEMASQLAAQMLQNPTEGEEATFSIKWLRPFYERPLHLNVYILCDPSAGKNRDNSDNTAMAVIGIDTLGNKYLLDGYRHKMNLQTTWEKLRGLYNKWSRAPGVQMVRVGYERYGKDRDIEHFEGEMTREDYYFVIEELAYPREGNKHSKTDRIQRLQPDMQLGRFFLPGYVWHELGALDEDVRNSQLAKGKSATRKSYVEWYVDEELEQLKFKLVNAPTIKEQNLKLIGQPYRAVQPIQRITEGGERQIYDLTRAFIEELRFHPFAPRDDLIDAVSRIYDMDPEPAVPHEADQIETPNYPD